MKKFHSIFIAIALFFAAVSPQAKTIKIKMWQIIFAGNALVLRNWLAASPRKYLLFLRLQHSINPFL